MSDSEDKSAVKHTFNIEIDIKSGRMIGNSEADPQSKFAEEIRGRIWEALGKTSEKEFSISKEIEDAANGGDHNLAAEIALSDRAKTSLYFARGDNMLRAALKINRAQLETATRQQLLLTIVSLASKVGKHGLVFEEVKELLGFDVTDNEHIYYSLRNMLALASYERGAHETAISIWQDLLKESQTINAGERGWIYRNLASALKNKSDSLSINRAERNYQCSADAFLEAGDKSEAASSLAQMAKLYEGRSADEAIKKYDDILALINERGLLIDEIRANIFHAKARRLMEIGNFSTAKNTALEAVHLRRGVLGTEEQLLSSLNLANLAAKQEGDENTADACAEEANSIMLQTPSKHFEVADRITKLLDADGIEDAADILRQAEANGDINLITGAKVAGIYRDETLSPLEKLSELETFHTELERQGIRGDTLTPVRLAVATLLKELSEFERAIPWYQRIVADQPLNVQTGALLVDTLWKVEQWGEAAIILAAQIKRFGEKPGYLYAYGRSLFEAGDMNGAITALTKSIKLAENGSTIELHSRELRDRAFELGGTNQPKPLGNAVTYAVTLKDVHAALSDFAIYISAAKRMVFWQKPKGQSTHKWISRPENLGQTLLHTFLRARFGEHANVFEEIGSGAGRLDILVQFEGGLSAIIELKMLGRNYSTTYAKSGEEQIRHYMKNLKINVGFLVVFDARDKANGALLLDENNGAFTIREVLIDSRPTVKT